MKSISCLLLILALSACTNKSNSGIQSTTNELGDGGLKGSSSTKEPILIINTDPEASLNPSATPGEEPIVDSTLSNTGTVEITREAREIFAALKIKEVKIELTQNNQTKGIVSGKSMNALTCVKIILDEDRTERYRCTFKPTDHPEKEGHDALFEALNIPELPSKKWLFERNVTEKRIGRFICERIYSPMYETSSYHCDYLRKPVPID